MKNSEDFEDSLEGESGEWEESEGEGEEHDGESGDDTGKEVTKGQEEGQDGEDGEGPDEVPPAVAEGEMEVAPAPGPELLAWLSGVPELVVRGMGLAGGLLRLGD
ncbi:hypothetical protein GPECTOR_4g716 [Gonium pectorale]|uniref:Uncharacterized protein n=1 Tax=Gonium pectorale TaxID=33097 RepID=A0A150GZ85_GONPE|nr:hypothetical protein GPECTOR_4g716 [Gonium pectorale]|eukprot:KXZ54650.1 hypothetical protein GPECTOR_4g716 [Gonium pectorale]